MEDSGKQVERSGKLMDPGLFEMAYLVQKQDQVHQYQRTRILLCLQRGL